MNILVTGGAGFIGSHLVDKLVEDKNKVTVIDNLSNGRIENLSKSIKKIKFIKDDISNISSWGKKIKNIEYVIHLAALADIVPSIETPKKYFEANVNGTFNLVNFFKSKKLKKLIYAASSSCYGLANNYPTLESDPIDTRYPYALTKFLGEEIVMHWNSIYKIPSISLRFFNVFGKRSRTAGTYGAVFGTFLAQKMNNKPLTVVGDGNQKRDFIYVNDVVEAIIKSLKSNISGQIFNIGSGKATSINYLVQLLDAKKINIPKRPGEPDITQADISKAKKILKWKPEISFEEGVNILLEDTSFWKSSPVWDKKSIKKATKEWFKYVDDK